MTHIPKPYETFSKKFPDLLEKYRELGEACRNAGPLEEKYQDLIKLGIAAGANSRGAVMSAVRKALKTGSTPDELRHAVLLALTTTGFPNAMAAMSWVDEVLAREQG